MKTIMVSCNNCGNDVAKPAKEIRRRRKEGHDVFYCNISCAITWQNKNCPGRITKSTEHILRWNAMNNRNPYYQQKAAMAREGWKYVEIEALLETFHVSYEFEFPLVHEDGLYLYDLCITGQGLMIEFDGPHHCGKFSIYDQEKENYARTFNYDLVRIKVPQSVVYPASCLYWLVGVDETVRHSFH